MMNRRPEIILPPEELARELRRRTRRGFLFGALGAVGAAAAYEWITGSKEENLVSWPQRRILDFNRKLAHAYLDDSHLMPTYTRAQVTYLKPNGDIGLNPDTDPGEWKLTLEPGDGLPTLVLRLADIQALPKVELITTLCCIEGWNAIAHWGGVRFSDFTKKFLPSNRAAPPYVFMATPEEDYYVGLDRKSALHPQTLLAYEQNGKPLEAVHGAPLRLVIPTKYGIKNIKRVGLIRYMNEKPADYWAEEGYDWFAGL
jgi:DMSO/TMAO reductase YedYZ molybdopterin-dependent catalytic subunit